MNQQLKDKVVIITGGSSGIGKACAEVFGRAGAKIVISGRDPLKLEEAGQQLREQGVEVLTVCGDVSKEEDVKQMIEATIVKFGTIHILINNAGISMRALFEDLDLEVLRKVMDINFWGTVYATKYALPYIIGNKGSIIGISSIAGYRGLPGRTGYSASKAGMHGFLESLRTELLKKDVHVLVACPGFTASNIRNTALAKDGKQQGETPRDETEMMSAEEVARHLLQATVKRKRDLVLTTQGKLTVFLNKWVPAFMDKMVYKHFAQEKDSPLK